MGCTFIYEIIWDTHRYCMGYICVYIYRYCIDIDIIGDSIIL